MLNGGKATGKGKCHTAIIYEPKLFTLATLSNYALIYSYVRPCIIWRLQIPIIFTEGSQIMS